MTSMYAIHNTSITFLIAAFKVYIRVKGKLSSDTVYNIMVNLTH